MWVGDKFTMAFFLLIFIISYIFSLVNGLAQIEYRDPLCMRNYTIIIASWGKGVIVGCMRFSSLRSIDYTQTHVMLNLRMEGTGIHFKISAIYKFLKTFDVF